MWNKYWWWGIGLAFVLPGIIIYLTIKVVEGYFEPSPSCYLPPPPSLNFRHLLPLAFTNYRDELIKKYRHKLPSNVWEKFLTRKIDLKYFVFEITPKCNQACIFCYNVWRYHPYPMGNINLDDWEPIIAHLKKETGVQVITLSGGEPLMHPRLFDLLKLINKYGLKSNLITNASLVDQKTAQKLADHKVSNIEVSLVAPNRKDHMDHKGTDDLDQVINGIANLKKAGNRLLTVFIATQNNIHLLKETLDLSIVLGSQGLMFNRINPATKDHIELLPSPKQLVEALGYLEWFAQKYQFPVSSSIPIQPCVIDMNRYPHLSHGYCPSGGSRSYYTVDFSGRLRICNHSPHILGNLLKENFRDIIKHDHVEKFKTVLPKNCGDCELIEKCRGGCKAASELCYGCLSCSDPLTEFNTKSKPTEA